MERFTSSDLPEVKWRELAPKYFRVPPNEQVLRDSIQPKIPMDEIWWSTSILPPPKKTTGEILEQPKEVCEYIFGKEAAPVWVVRCGYEGTPSARVWRECSCSQKYDIESMLRKKLTRRIQRTVHDWPVCRFTQRNLRLKIKFTYDGSSFWLYSDFVCDDCGGK